MFRRGARRCSRATVNISSSPSRSDGRARMVLIQSRRRGFRRWPARCGSGSANALDQLGVHPGLLLVGQGVVGDLAPLVPGAYFDQALAPNTSRTAAESAFTPSMTTNGIVDRRPRRPGRPAAGAPRSCSRWSRPTAPTRFFVPSALDRQARLPRGAWPSLTHEHRAP